MISSMKGSTQALFYEEVYVRRSRFVPEYDERKIPCRAKDLPDVVVTYVIHS
jgi:hypothetical protein